MSAVSEDQDAKAESSGFGLNHLTPRIESWFADLAERRFEKICRSARDLEVFDLRGIDAHDPAAGGVDRRDIAARDQDSGVLRGPLNGAVSFHTHASIDDGELPRDAE